jgi:glutathione S-transferase
MGGEVVKLYMHPVSNTSRPIRLFIAEHRLPVEEQVVDLFTGEHHQPPFVALNPSRQVPVLEDGDFRLTESSAILKYLADRFELAAAYPRGLKERARVNEAMDWFNTQFARDYGYGVAYPQLYPHHRRPTPEIQDGVVAWGLGNARTWFGVLDSHWLGGGRPYVAGDAPTIADYFGVCMATLGEVIRSDLSAWPNVTAWIARMKRLSSWDRVNEAHHGFIESVKAQSFRALAP